MKCVTWSPYGLDHFISLLLSFLIPNLGFCILGTLVGSRSFVELFIDFGTTNDELQTMRILGS